MKIHESRVNKVVHQIYQAIKLLHSFEIYLGYMNPSHFCLDDHTNIRLSEWAYYHLLKFCDKTSMKMIQPYIAPEIISSFNQQIPYKITPESDIWSIGVILLEYVYGESLPFYDLFQKSIRGEETSIYHKIIEYVKNEENKVLPLIRDCLLYRRFELDEKVHLPYHYKPFPNLKLNEKIYPMTNSREFTINEVYNKWKAHLEQIEQKEFSEELRKNFPIGYYPTLFRTSRIYTFSKECKIKSNTFFDSASFKITGKEIHKMEKIKLAKREEDEREINFFSSFSNVTGDLRKTKLPYEQLPSLKTLLSSKDGDLVYQTNRVKLFRKLLLDYPQSRYEIIKQAQIDIPAVLRGEIWAAVLNCEPDEVIKEIYDSIDTISPHPCDRQISVDVPRCHQYCSLLASKEGHNKLNRILKAWVIHHQDANNLVYWQGIDSLTAPFLTLNFHYEARVFGCLIKMVNLYLADLYVKDNSFAMDYKLTLFIKLLTYHEPLVAKHMKEVGYYPELFGIPWFLTLYAHVLSIEKLYKLWDAFILGSPHLPSYFGLAIMKRMKKQLLESDFFGLNKALQQTASIDIIQCIHDADQLLVKTPETILSPPFIFECLTEQQKKERKMSISLKDYKEFIYPRIDEKEFKSKLSHISVIIDVRPNEEYEKEHFHNAMNIDPMNQEQIQSLIELLNFKQGLPITIIPDFEMKNCHKLENLLFQKGYPYISIVLINEMNEDNFY